MSALITSQSGFRGRVGPDAAARVMRVLGEAARPLWSELTPAEARVITAQMDDLSTDNPAADRDALEAFLRDSAAARTKSHRPVDVDLKPASFWRSLDETHAPTLAAMMGRESPQVAAWMVSQLDPKLAAQILRMLDEHVSLSVLQRILDTDAVPAAVSEVIEASLGATLERLSLAGDSQGHAKVARIFDQLGSSHERSLLAALDAQAPGSGEKVRAQMFTFDDLRDLTAAGMQTLLVAVDRSVLAIALKGAREDVANAFFSNLTRRAGLVIREEMAALGALRRSEIEAARTEIVDTARDLIRDGQIRLSVDGEPDDELVE